MSATVAASLRPAQLYDELVAAGLGAKVVVVRGFNTNSETGIATSGEIEGTITQGEADPVIAAHLPEKLGVDITVFRQKRTTNATPLVMATYTPPTSSAARFEVRVTASNGTSVNFYWMVAQVKRGAGNAIMVGAPQNVIAAQEDQAAWNAAISVSGTDIQLTVTGAAGTTIQWLAEITGRVFNP